MARLADRLEENAEGDLFVDRSCIDCDTCRQLAPSVFARSDRADQSIVQRQPTTRQEAARAFMALVACPTASIGTRRKSDGAVVRAAANAFPEEIEDGVFYCGFASSSSYGASSYLIRRPAGNVLVDSPRASRPLLKRLTDLGGVDLMFLTHCDDVADHRQFHAAFGCRRILHRRDVRENTRDVEHHLEGDDPVALADDLLAIPVPGHTRGSTALLYQERFLFSGDHLWWSDQDGGGGGDGGSLAASRSVCWYSWTEQVRSLRRLLDHRFQWILPGHGARHRAPSSEAMRQEIEALLRCL
jgi:glyoxylase-like metal-dependent hydrolase (beta-lactamase superfamily II)/ferredoxin